MNKLKSTKISTAFLATVLVLRTIALSIPSFMSTASAQAESYYGMENGYDSYEPEPEYQQQYTDREYNSYEPEYGMEDSYKKSYRNDYYEQPGYPSYQPDYKPSYGKETYKSKDNVIVKKLNCINTSF